MPEPFKPYRKRPVVVEVTEPVTPETVHWLAMLLEGTSVAPEGLLIPTLEGDHLARWGDRIIRGVNGELYPIKSEIFEQTYERAYGEPPHG